MSINISKRKIVIIENVVEKVDIHVEYIISFILNKRGIIVNHQIVLYWTADLFLDVQNKVINFFNAFSLMSSKVP